MVVVVLGAAQIALAQTTIFAYQGRLEFDGVPANGQFDFQFKLFDATSGGSQQGLTLEQLNLAVTNGDYKVNLDFGAAVFSGADRYLEVSYRMGQPYLHDPDAAPADQLGAICDPQPGGDQR